VRARRGTDATPTGDLRSAWAAHRERRPDSRPRRTLGGRYSFGPYRATRQLEDGTCPPTPPPNERFSLKANPVSGNISRNGRFRITKRIAGGVLSITGVVNGRTAVGTIRDRFPSEGSVCQTGTVRWRAQKQ
jgi:hypothetical protein